MAQVTTRAFAAAVSLFVAVLAGCGGGADATRVRGEVLTVYLSVPRDGVSAAAGDAAAAGARRALARAGHHVRGRRVRLVTLPSTRPGGERWDPGTVEANAEQAARDPTAIAYLGELDLGGSAVSLPVTNGAGLLQVAPADGLTSLTRSPPGRPRAGPERYYPAGTRTFLRLVPNDLALAEALLDRAAPLLERAAAPDPGRLAILHTEGIAERELAGVLADRAAGSELGEPSVEAIGDEPAAAAALARDLAARPPAAIVLAAIPSPATAALVAALRRRLPKTPMLVAASPSPPPELASGAPRGSVAAANVVAAADQPPRARRLLARLEAAEPGPVRGEATHGYEAMRLVLDAVRTGGPDRAAVARAALTPRRRRSLMGGYSVLRSGDVAGLPVAVRPLAPAPRLRGVRR